MFDITWDDFEPCDPEAIYECDRCHNNIATQGELCEECQRDFEEACRRHLN